MSIKVKAVERNVSFDKSKKNGPTSCRKLLLEGHTPRHFVTPSILGWESSVITASLIESIRPTQPVRAEAAILVLSKFYG